MFSCDKCGYTSTDRSNFRRHCNRKVPCLGGKHTILPGQNNSIGVQNNSIGVQNNNTTSNFNKLNNSHYECLKCKKIISTHLARHLKSCKGVPSLTCKVCKKVFKHQSSHSRHQISCKRKQELSSDTHTPETNGSTIINNNNNTTINNNTINYNINIQFGNESIQELLLKGEHDERFLALSAKLREKQNTRIEIEHLVASKDNYDSNRHHDMVLQEQHNSNELFHVLMDLVYFNKDIPQNHTIRKTNKKSEMIEIRDNELWSPMPTNSVVKTILNPICKLAQGMADVPEDMFATKKYTKQNFNEIMYSKTQRGYLTEQRILQPYEKRPLDTSSGEWQAFHNDWSTTYIPCFGLRQSDLDKDTIMNELEQLSVRHQLDNFSPKRDGEPIFEEILKRFPE